MSDNLYAETAAVAQNIEQYARETGRMFVVTITRAGVMLSNFDTIGLLPGWDADTPQRFASGETLAEAWVNFRKVQQDALIDDVTYRAGYDAACGY